MKTPAEQLDRIKGRCVVTEDGCWLWRGGTSSGGVPCIRSIDNAHPDKPPVPQPGRRVTWQLSTGRVVPAGWRVYGTCSERACIAPDHVFARAPAKHAELLRAAGVPIGLKNNSMAEHMVILCRNGRKRSKLTESTTAQILASEATAATLAKELDISTSLVKKVRSGRSKAWQPLGGMFSGLL